MTNNKSIEGIIEDTLKIELTEHLEKYFYDNPTEECDCAGLWNLCQIWASDKVKNLLERIAKDLAADLKKQYGADVDKAIKEGLLANTRLQMKYEKQIRDIKKLLQGNYDNSKCKKS